jgi:glycosyltransferase involved in cell wall biosynthesis
LTVSGPAISVIIRTLAEERRRDAIRRALQSIISQRGVRAIPIVVANGDRFDPALLAELEARSDLRFHYLEQASLPAALLRGRAMVDTPFFCFLDDDDEYLPDGLRERMAMLLEDAEADVVVGGGYRVTADQRSPSGWKKGNAGAQDPLRELLVDNWLQPCSALFRSSRIGVDFFHDAPAYFEWTYPAFKLCLTKQIRFCDLPGHMIHDTDSSASKSENYQLAEASVIQHILRLPLPDDVHRAMCERRGAAMHQIADHYRRSGKFGPAWSFHLKSVIERGGLQYVPYTRKLLSLWIKKKVPE